VFLYPCGFALFFEVTREFDHFSTLFFVSRGFALPNFFFSDVVCWIVTCFLVFF